MARALLVPMVVDAIVVTPPRGNRAFRLHQPMADFSALPTGEETGSRRQPFDGSQLGRLSPPFGGETPATPGVHLHWALPAALMHAYKDEDGDDAGWQAVPAPDRWLVTRVALDGDGTTIAARHFVVESDRLAHEERSASGLRQPTVPVEERSDGQRRRFGFRYLGRRFDLEGWREDPAAERLAPFTALGYGSMTFAAYYPNCSTVFGFCDRAADILRGEVPGRQRSVARLMYHVAGWYSDADPLSSPEHRKQLDRFWHGLDDDGWTHTLIHGATPGLAWEGNRSGSSLPKEPVRFTLGVAENDTLSAAVADWARIPELEAFCNGLQQGLIQDGTDSVDSLETYRRAMRRSEFSERSGGREWVIRPKQPERTAGLDPHAEIPPLPARWNAPLVRLNRLERAVDDGEARLAGMRQALFADWCRYQSILYGDADIPIDPNLVEKARQSLLAAARAIEAAADAVAAGRSDLGKLVAQLLPDVPGEYELTVETRPGWSQPANPVLAMEGGVVRWFDRWHPQTDAAEDRRLGCRAAEQVLRRLAYRLGDGPERTIVAPADIAAGLGDVPEPKSGIGLGPLVASLLGEAMLLEPGLLPALAAPAAGSERDDLVRSVKGLRTPELAAEAEGSSVSVEIGEALLPPLFDDRDYSDSAPFMPLFGQYEVKYDPEFPDGPRPDDLVRMAGWSREGDVPAARGTAAGATAGTPYTGLGIITEMRLDSLLDAAARVGNGRPELEVREAFEAIEPLRLMAMELSGLNWAMLGLNEAMQVRVDDRYASVFRRADVDAVANAVEGQGLLSPRPMASFSPVRAGTLALSRVRLLDVFGRYYDESPERVAYAKRLREAGAPGAEGAGVRLPPRVLHPMRLDFQWINADTPGEESTCHPASSPVFGWLLVNRMDNGLVVFGADGTRLFSLSPDALEPDGSLRKLWAPGERVQPSNARLQGFLATFEGREGAGRFVAFLKTLAESLETVHPEVAVEGGNLGLLVGRPLALARARVRVEAKGIAPTSQAWLEYRAWIESGFPRGDGGVHGLELPLVLGDRSEYDDGLAVYWRHDGGAPDYARPFAPVGDTAAERRLQEALPRLAVGAEQGEMFTLLVDPRAPVHLRCGVLPGTEARLADEHHAAAYRHLDVVFRAGPLLVAANGSESFVPAPRAIKGEWRWWGPDGSQTAVAQEPDAKLPDAGTLRLSDGWLRRHDS